MTSTSGRMLLVHTGAVAEKATRSTQGGGDDPEKATGFSAWSPCRGYAEKPARYRMKSFPALGPCPRRRKHKENK